MRIKIEGDWSGTVSFFMGSMAVILMTAFVSRASSAEKLSASGAQHLYIIAGLYLVVAAILGIMAARGRTVPDGSTVATWENTGFDFWGNIMSTIVLWAMAMGTEIFLIEGQSGDIKASIMVPAIVLLVAVWGIAWLNFGARIIVFTPKKEVIVMKGRPLTFIRKTYKPQDWLGLHVSWQQGYNGGMYRSSPDNLYFVWGVYDGGVIKLNTVAIPQETKRATALQMVHELVEETAENVGLPVPPWPNDKDIYLNLWK